MPNFRSKIIEIISNQFGSPASEITLQSHLTRDLNATPLEKADLIPLLEAEFKIKIPEEESVKFETVGDIVNFIYDHTDEFAKV